MAENKATLTIVFEGGADSSLLAIAKPDDALNKDAKGETKTQFLASDRPYFIVHLDDSLKIARVSYSSGSVRYLGQVVREAVIDTLDADVEGDSVDLEYNPSSALQATWYGNAPVVSMAGRKATFTGALPATGEGKYSYRCYSYQYVPPPLAPNQKWRSRIVVHVVPA